MAQTASEHVRDLSKFSLAYEREILTLGKTEGKTNSPGEGDTGRIRSVQITMVRGTGRGDGCIEVNNIKA